MSETRNVLIAVLIVNSLAIGGVLYEIDYFDEGDLDISTIVTAKLVIKFTNLGENDRLTFETVTTSESTAYGILLRAQTEGSYSITATTHYELGLFVESIAGWGTCGSCQNEDGFYWLYYVNNNDGDVAANRKIISDGDLVEWNYTNEY